MAPGSPKRREEKERLKGAPWNSAPYKKTTPFSRDDDSVDDTCIDGVCLRDKKGPTKDDDYDRYGRYGRSNSPKLVRGKPEHDTDYGMESPKGSGKKHSIVPPAGNGRRPQYTAPVSTSPKKDTYNKTANNRPLGPSTPWSKPETDTQKAGRNHLFEPTAGRHPQYTAPISTAPKDTYYDTANNSPLRRKPEFDTDHASDSPKASRNPSFVPPATIPVKDSYYDTAYNSKPAHDNGKPKYAQQPQSSAPVTTQPRKEGHPQTIDSREASKRYGGQAVNKPNPEEEYTGTIDCKEAARKYKGIFVP
ncbi:Uncharacterized protein Adt_33885 [Abeliophyllum distichum]|uniref:Uncharacterized protein n=1 Tax=Abeliophyllum distichum TaxID=126358 RepID=A0ABD1QXI0_9LAMI